MIKYSNEHVMRELTRMVSQQFTQGIADKARQFAGTLPANISAHDALWAFAAAIESTNEKQWGKEKPDA